ncbi:MAG: hypothetical protein Q9208_003517 [Pyrenodesmia sp. 3 TL-2023]
MSRTVADATRFTATSPHAYSRPSSILRSANPSFSPSSYSASGSLPTSRGPRPSPTDPDPQPPTPTQHETPQQKVARLRALRAAEKLKPLSLWDRTVVRVVAGVVTAFSLYDMLIYNRNQRSLFYATQAAIYTQTLQRAIAAQAENRSLTDEETQVLNREKAVLQAEAAKEQRQSLPWTQRLFGSREPEGAKEQDGGRDKVWGNAEVEGRESLVDIVKEEGVQGVVKPVGEVVAQSRVMQALQEKKRESEGQLEEVRAMAEPLDQVAEHSSAGQLDRMAEGAMEKGKKGVDKAKGGWSNWFGSQG